MNLKRIKHLTLSEAARLCETSLETLCDWLLENPVRLEARSDLDLKYHPVSEESYESLLAATAKEIETVAFIYPPEYDKFRRLPKRRGEAKGKIRRTDEQTLTRAQLRIPTDEFLRVRKTVIEEIGVSETYGLKKVRRTRRNWQRIHNSILTAANELLKENPDLYLRKNGEPVYAKLAKDIDNKRKRWPDLADEPPGTTVRNMIERIGELKNKLKVPKTNRK